VYGNENSDPRYDTRMGEMFCTGEEEREKESWGNVRRTHNKQKKKMERGYEFL
jgi:hypothetical protein